MTSIHPIQAAQILRHIRDKTALGELRLTQHGHQEMVADGFTLDEIIVALNNADVLENYPDH